MEGQDMTDYTELVKALRHCATRSNGCATCEGCPMSSENGDVIECINALHKDAADAIEALQAAEPTERQVVDYCHKRCLVVLEADLFHELKASYGKMPKRGEWLPPNEHRPMWECSRCGWYVDEGGRKDFTYCPNCGARMKGADDE